MTYIKQVTSLEETEDFGKRLGSLVRAQDVITLEGDLGAGKTTFTKSFAKGLGVTRNVNSPTFTILKQYEGRLPFNHLDVYRLADSDEDLGWDELFYGEAVTVIEWAKLIEYDLPDERLQIEVFYENEFARRFEVTPMGERYEQLCKELFA
ncbi:tRNA (adenosine(37)-N6)-threonylcarbamoyltransferase complex ATPase subunit type 1 TsaE [Paenisporosarcina indica]|uniref:tRNA (adenosine(37)-N6)-threonylcarbamoyltransferase complex ATPase subunit type 1 TsaE n=1 Tax=Paenisporosarcina indica TaxID=650093 RepID=UPI0009501BAA|nr:tRNA (adenosine(37)-N6)-threonylcarbamoyltransferase complex ATPase subunit type 1 TsaE [Paenisporosarcina indica]